MVERAEGQHVDRRIIRTQRAIRNALFSLPTTTDYDKITITALADQAKIDRKTFYTHYASIDELFEDTIRQRSAFSLADLSLKDLLSDPKHFANQYFSALDSSLPLSREQRAQIMRHVPMHKFLHLGTVVTHEQLTRELGGLRKNVPTDELDRLNVTIELCLGGIFHAYAWWVSSQSSMTLDEVMEIMGCSIAGGVESLLAEGLLHKEDFEQEPVNQD